MSHAWSFVAAAYAVAALGVGGLLGVSLVAMHRAERRARLLEEEGR